QKIVVAVVIYNRFENLSKWLSSWSRCNKHNAKLVIIHNRDENFNNSNYKKACELFKVQYVERKNVGFDIGAFQDVALERLKDFPEFNVLFWATDDCIPMSKDFLSKYLDKINDADFGVTCTEISKQITLHMRTSGFCIKKETLKKLKFPTEKILTKAECYYFEHKGGDNTFYKQILNMNLKVEMISELATSPMWDIHNRASLKRMDEYYNEFKEIPQQFNRVEKICIVTTFDRNYKEAGKTLFNSIRRHTDCSGIDFKI
ncbi:MAG: hypothetical protein AABY22_18500, partial [Nanoarchaeota archaeon]